MIFLECSSGLLGIAISFSLFERRGSSLFRSKSSLFCSLQVTVNGVDYQPQAPSPNKKHAKAMAATVALQALGEVTE